MSNWGWLWAIWATLALAGFFVIELDAVFTHHLERTLSDNLRKWLGIYPPKPWRKLGGLLFATGLLAGAAVLVWHILTP